MALKKSVTFKSSPFSESITGEYWVITRIECEKINNLTRVVIELYENEEKSKQQNDYSLPISPLSLLNFFYTGLDYTRADLYNKIKLEPQFEGYEDC